MVTIEVPPRGKLTVYLPYAPGNREFIQRFSRQKKKLYNPVRKSWQVDRCNASWFIETCKQKYDVVEIHHIFVPAGDKCTTSCQQALSDNDYSCECICGGRYHGSGNTDGFQVGDILIVGIGAGVPVVTVERFVKGQTVSHETTELEPQAKKGLGWGDLQENLETAQ